MPLFSFAFTGQNNDLKTKSYQELWELYSETKDDSLKLNSAKAYYEKALEDKDSIKLLEGNFAIGVVHGMNDRHKMALPYFESAFLLSTTEKTKRVPLLLLLDWKSYVEFRTEDINAALQTINTALITYKNDDNLQPKRSLVKMYDTAARCYLLKKDIDKYIKSIEEEILLSNSIGDDTYLESLMFDKQNFETLKKKNYKELNSFINKSFYNYTHLAVAALVYCTKAVKDKNLLEQAVGLSLIGKAYANLGFHKNSLDAINRAEALGKNLKNKEDWWLPLMETKSIYQLRKSNYESALKTIDTSFLVYNTNKNLQPLSSLVVMHYTAAETFRLKNDYEASLERINQGIAFSKTLDEKPLLETLNTAKSQVLLRKSFAEQDKGEYVLALKNLDSLSNNKILNSEEFWLNLGKLYTIAVLKTNAEFYKEARKILKAALLRTKTKNFKEGSLNEKRLENWISSFHIYISITYLRENKPDSAFYHIEELDKRISFLFDPCNTYFNHGLKAYAYLLKEDFNNAEKLINKAKTICDTISGRTAANAFLSGLLYNGKKEYIKAKQILYQAIADYETNLKRDAIFIEYYKQLATSYKGLKQFDSASVYLENILN